MMHNAEILHLKIYDLRKSIKQGIDFWAGV